MKRLHLVGLLALSLAFTLSGCGLTPPETEMTEEPLTQATIPAASIDPALLGPEWKLVSYGPITATTPALATSTVTLIFNEDGTAGGAGGCNGYGGNYAVAGNAITFTEVISTMMACEDAVMNQEIAVLGGLQAATSYQLSGEMLAIVYEGEKALIFTSGAVQPVDAAPTAETSAWVITITSPADGAVLDLSQPVTITGTGQGLFEGALVVEVVDAGGNSLAFEPTILQGEDVGAGGFGEWSVTLTITAPAGSTGQVHAFATSPEDGRILVEAFANVTFN